MTLTRNNFYWKKDDVNDYKNMESLVSVINEMERLLDDDEARGVLLKVIPGNYTKETEYLAELEGGNTGKGKSWFQALQKLFKDVVDSAEMIMED